MTKEGTHRVIEGVWRIESARIIGALARMLRDVGLAEELAQDALVGALERWPTSGIPDNPAAWLMAVAKNRALDHLRHARLHQSKEAELTYEIETQLEDAAPDLDAALDDDFGDDMLRAGFIPLPHLFLRHYRKLGLSHLQALFVLQLMEIAWDVGDPPSTVTRLAERLGVDRRTVSPDRVMGPASPYVLQTGAVIAACGIADAQDEGVRVSHGRAPGAGNASSTRYRGRGCGCSVRSEAGFVHPAATASLARKRRDRPSRLGR